MSAVSLYDAYLLLVVALVKTTGRLPSKTKQIIVNGITRIAYWFSISKRRQSEANLRRVFGDTVNQQQIQTIVGCSFHEFWQDVFAWLPSKTEQAALAGAELEGMDHLQQALAAGKGVILLESSCFGARGWSKQVLHLHRVNVHQVHVERHLASFARGPDTYIQRKYIKPILDDWEKTFIAAVIKLPQSDSLTYTRQLLDILKGNQVVCVAGDGHTGQKHINLPFLGQERSFATGIVSLAKLSGAPLLPLFCLREPDNKTRLIVEPPLNFEANTKRDARIEDGLAQYVALLESYIRAYPSHYQNWHFRQRSNY